MGACRQTFSLWHYLKRIFKRPSHYFGRWYCIKQFLFLRINGTYFWHDSFGRYLNRWFVCPFFGHRDLKYLSDGDCSGDDSAWHCFACEKSFKEKPI